MNKIIAKKQLITFSTHGGFYLFDNVMESLLSLASSLKHVTIPSNSMTAAFRDTFNLETLTILRYDAYNIAFFCCKTVSLEIDYHCVHAFDGYQSFPGVSSHLSSIEKLIVINGEYPFVLRTKDLHGIMKHSWFSILCVDIVNKAFKVNSVFSYSSIMDNQNFVTTFSAPKPAIQRGKITWPDESSQPQNFSLPSSIIYYISKNPSNPTVYLKLVQSCKYFFEKLPLLIAKDIYDENLVIKICRHTVNECFHYYEKCCVSIDLNKISSKLWLTNDLTLGEQSSNSNFISILSSKLYQSDICRLALYDLNVKFDDFKLIASSARKVSLAAVKIVYDDGSLVKLDAILEVLSNIEKCDIYCNSSIFDSTTIKNIAKLQNLSNLYELDLFGIPEVENVEHFLTIIKEHKDAKFYLNFVDNISEDFKNQLRVLIDAVLKEETIKCVIKYNGQDEEKFRIMERRNY